MIAHALIDTDLQAARAALEESLALRREAGAVQLGIESKSTLCSLLLAAGEYESAEQLAQEIVTSAGRDREVAQSARRYLADARLSMGDYAEAERRYRAAIRHAREHALTRVETTACFGLAASLIAQGQHASGLRLAAGVRQRRLSLGLPEFSPARAWREFLGRSVTTAVVALGDTEAAAAQAAGRSIEWESLVVEQLAAPTLR